MTAKPRAPGTPWFRVPTVWLLIAIPLSSVVAGLVMLGLSLTTFDGLVVDDYYKRGKEINRILARDRLASELGITADVAFRSDTHRVYVALTSDDARRLPASITLRLLHPTRGGQDHTLELERDATTTYSGSLPELSHAQWIVQLGTADWRLSGALDWPTQRSVSLRFQDQLR